MKVKQYLKQVEGNTDYGICPPPTDAQTGLNVLIEYFLGSDWYVPLPLSTEQVNTEAICLILSLYNKNGRIKLWKRIKKNYAESRVKL
jgi:hypothetical protein